MKKSTQASSRRAPSTLSRRGVLRSSTALVALPFLESLTRGQTVQAAEQPTSGPPKRLIFLGMGFGVTADRWYPDINTVGQDYELPGVLKPLQRHKSDISIIQNLMHQYSADGHSGSTFWLTGANRYAVPGQSFHNTVSVDQLAAETLGQQTRFTSIQLAAKVGYASDGHGPGSSLAWNRFGKPVAGIDTPVAAFHKMFSNDTTPLAQRQQQLADQSSVLDTVLMDAGAVNRKLNPTDKQKLDEYLQSIREIEVRLSKEEKWLTIDKRQPQNPVDEPGESLAGVEEIRMMYDLMVAAMQVDASRVFTYRMPSDSLIQSLGATMTSHTMSHFSEGERRTVSMSRDTTHAKLLAEFFDKLKASKEADGSSLFDHCSITFGSNLSSVHSLNNCPTLIAGGGAGIKQGRHLVMGDRKTPLCNLWLSLLNGSGIQANSFGDSTGLISELFDV
ncbi:hypothetical protein K227x_34030 [Rubripirellula lacrimiformis]|uniref:Secreted protein containing DUF1552 n=1 Tax=Rubripirellula lacrimiformis TaxID=1930273 RepID=A0A517NCZ5_9BACT|nr:DUF1552 domain-containing protein [Rubripirellula lacrimiformis]QDT05005.1 hypothetical protein K227x_34030 [Rubripirellula lacrimiformis]